MQSEIFHPEKKIKKFSAFVSALKAVCQNPQAHKWSQFTQH